MRLRYLSGSSVSFHNACPIALPSGFTEKAMKGFSCCPLDVDVFDTYSL